ncbi:MAG: protein kinase [Acidobacteriota bacterium]
MTRQQGTRIGPYEITSLLGVGGMGEVYKARDTRLERSVALKFVSAELSGDSEARIRFRREAMTIAAITHPNICALYDVGETEDFEVDAEHQSSLVSYLVMELVDGTTLAERLLRGPMKPEEAVACATGVAQALSAAHAVGIVHRDLKPANIMLTRSGVKLLDFGLALFHGIGPVDGKSTDRTVPHSRESGIAGTLQYMAPEQLEGKPPDARSDIFAFGAILYEMLSGRRAFEGSSQASLIATILHSTPLPVPAIDPSGPLQRLIGNCLKKDADERWASAHDLVLALQGIVSDTRQENRESAGRRTPASLAGWVAAAIFALLAVAALLQARRAGTSPAPGLDLYSILPPATTVFSYGEAPQISPDGSLIALLAHDVSGTSMLYIRRRGIDGATAIAGSEGAFLPFWSPDSRSLGFFADGKLKTVSLNGGMPQTIASAPVPRGGTWGRNGDILFIGLPSLPPFRVPADGGEAVPVPIAPGSRQNRWFPTFLPDGHHYLYLGVGPPDPSGFSVWAGSIDSAEVKEILKTKTTVAYAPGYLLYRREAALMAQPFDAARLEFTGAATPVAEGIGYNAITYQSLFSVSSVGTLVYKNLAAGPDVGWFDRGGKRTGTAAPAGDYNTVCMTAGEKLLVYELADPATGSIDLWSRDLSSGSSTRITFDPAVDFYPVCSPSGTEAIFASLRMGPPNLYREDLRVPGSEKLIFGDPFPKIPSDWSRDGLLLIFSVLHPKTNWDIFAIPSAGGSPLPVIATAAEERNGKLSPDGHWIAYVSNESGSFEVYVQPFPPSGPKWQVSRGGGLQPEWRSDGGEMYFIGRDGKLMAVDVAGEGVGAFIMGEPRPLFETRMTGWEPVLLGTQYAASRDGSRFVVITAPQTPQPITVMLNWPAALPESGR